MKNLFYLAVIFSTFLYCKQANEAQYKIISYEAGNAAKIDRFTPGDTLIDLKSELNLKQGEQLMVNNMSTSQVFLIEGPTTIIPNSIDQGKIVSFNDKYVSLIKENLNKSDKQVRQAVLGGVFRGEPAVINYLEGQNTLSKVLSPHVRYPEFKTCIIKIYRENELLHECKGNIDCEFDLTKIRSELEDVSLVIKSICGTHKSEVAVNVVSTDKAKKLNAEEAQLIKANMPDLVMLNFYLENKLFDKATNIAMKTDDNSKIVRQIKSVLK